jgi:hypothetical protein
MRPARAIRTGQQACDCRQGFFGLVEEQAMGRLQMDRQNACSHDLNYRG